MNWRGLKVQAKVPVARKMNSKARTTVISTKHPAPVRKVEKFQKSDEAREKGKPRATTSVTKRSKKRKALKNILSEEEVEELCERLESKRHDLDCEIARKLESSPNLAFYLSRVALKEAILGDKNEITDEFIGLVFTMFITQR